ncbi:MAG: hypothetical protein JO127_18225 [Caulobacteraceae bacterium]|nr:hypothetical protein [Caulobacteraceae bacterium]
MAEMPRMLNTSWFSAPAKATTVRPGEALVSRPASEVIPRACSWRPAIAETAMGTRCRGSSRRWAVTTTSGTREAC